MPLGGLGIAAAGGIGGALAGNLLSAGDRAKADAARQAAVQQWLSINVPDPAQQAIELQNYKVAGTLSPTLETAFQQNQTELKNMSVDPTSRAAEVKALTQMQNLASNGGMDAQSKQQEAQAINAANANEQGQRGAIVQNFAARGIGGAGAQLAAELQASQGDANTAAAGGMSSAAAAQQRALQAMTNSSSMAGTLNSQDYGQAAAAANAQDAINRFNTQTQQGVANTNVTAQNQAQATNLQNAQNVSNLNTGVANTQETHNKGLIQQQFEDQAKVAAGASNADAGVAAQDTADANNTSQLWGNIGNSLVQGGTAYGQYKKQQQDQQNQQKKQDQQTQQNNNSLMSLPDGETDLSNY